MSTWVAPDVAEEGVNVFTSSWEIEVNSRFVRDRLIAEVAASRRLAPSGVVGGPTQRMALERLRFAIGMVLIGLGRRLTDSTSLGAGWSRSPAPPIRSAH